MTAQLSLFQHLDPQPAVALGSKNWFEKITQAIVNPTRPKLSQTRWEISPSHLTIYPTGELTTAEIYHLIQTISGLTWFSGVYIIILPNGNYYEVSNKKLIRKDDQDA
jgi:hypothetical protein